MNLRLKPGKNFVPQGMPFIDPRTGKSFCGYQLGVDGAISAIIEHRQRNPVKYPADEYQWFSPSLVRQEFLRHVKSKNPSLLVGGGEPTMNPPVETGAPTTCICGGTEFTPEYCPTCGNGRKITGYKCVKCQTVRAA